MKITRLDDTEGFKQVEVAELSSFTIHTAQGRFSVHEDDGGGLTITESSHFHLALLPNVSNGVTIHAVHRDMFRPPASTDPTTTL